MQLCEISIFSFLHFLSQIDACNGFYCDGFKPNSHTKPTLWTEDWNGWYANAVWLSSLYLLLCLYLLLRFLYQDSLFHFLLGLSMSWVDQITWWYSSNLDRDGFGNYWPDLPNLTWPGNSGFLLTIIYFRFGFGGWVEISYPINEWAGFSWVHSFYSTHHLESSLSS